MDDTRARERADALLKEMHQLGVDHVYSRSFRLGPGQLLSNRFVLSPVREATFTERHPAVLATALRLGLPAQAGVLVQRLLPMSAFIHLGFEESPKGALYKLYLEKPFDPDRPQETEVASVAIKWDPARPQDFVATRYLRYLRVDAEWVDRRLDQTFRAPVYSPYLSLVRELFELAGPRCDPEDLEYLELDETESGRRSFDLNFYGARLEIREVAPILRRLGQAFELADADLDALLDRIGHEPFGHVAGGFHRDERPFVTVYHGMELRQAAPQLEN